MSGERRLTASAYPCRHCGNVGVLEILTEFSQDSELPFGDTLREVWWLARCPPCGKLNLLLYSTTDDYAQLLADEAEDWEAEVTRVLWPPPSPSPRGMPDPIGAAYRAAERVKPIDPNAYGVLLGRVLELTCRDRGAEGEDLFHRLEDLGRKEEIPQKLVMVAQGLRKLRNAGAHPDLGALSEGEVDLLADLARCLGVRLLSSLPRRAR